MYSEFKNSTHPIYIVMLLSVCLVEQASAYIIIIGNKNAALETLSIDNIVDIYSDENMVGQAMLQGVNLPSKSSSYKAFYQLINTSPEEISSLQSKILFSNPFAYKAPITKNTSKEVIKTIATHST